MDLRNYRSPRLWVGSALLVVGAAAVAATPSASEAIAVTKASVHRAEQAGAPEFAPVDLAASRDKLQRADQAVADRKIDLANQLASEGVGFYPQLSPRSVDFRMNWDSSMMFMSMPKGWHQVIAARGEDFVPVEPGRQVIALPGQCLLGSEQVGVG